MWRCFYFYFFSPKQKNLKYCGQRFDIIYIHVLLKVSFIYSLGSLWLVLSCFLLRN